MVKMRKSASVAIPLLLALIVIVLLVGCSNEIPTAKHVTPFQESVSFSPDNDSLFDFQFDYPANWDLLREDKSYRDNILVMDVIRKRDPSKPVPDCEIEFGCDTRPTIIFLAILIDPSTQSLEHSITTTRKLSQSIVHISIISEQVVIIDGYEGHAITTYNSILQTTTTSIILQVDNRSYSLVINLLAQEDLDGDFHKVFWDIVESIRFNPKLGE